MRQVIRHIILLTTLLLLEVTSSAQGVSTFPVQVTTQVMSPSVYLTDYESGFEERVSVILLNRDVMSTGVDVRLRLTIKCQNGLTLRTKPSAVFEAISLYPGSPERLGMSDLSPYFDVRNLDVNGSLVQGTLPEGLATFTFEAVEYHTGVVVSTQGVAVTNLTMNKPPALLFPMDRSVINSRAARSVLFQWQPRHTYTQEGVTYEITLKEITDTLANPTSAYNYSQSIYQTETTGTSLIYSVSEPPLEAGKRYGWCVRAYRADGTGGSFTNGGYSEVFTFDVRETPLDNQTDVKDSISDTPVKKQEKDYSHCGEDNYRVTNLTPTDALEVGDTITVGGGFKVVLTTLRQSGYLYSGEGYMYIPYVGLTFAVDFNGIKVNTERQLIEGYTEVRRDASKAQIGGTDAILQGGANRLKNGVLLPDVTVDFNMEDASGADYDSVSNTVTVYDEEGSKVGSFTVPQNETGESVFPVTVKDKAGNIVRIDEETDADGKPTGKYKFTPLGSQSAGQHVSEQTLSTLRSDLGSVDFEEDADGIYTFDQPLDYYETVSLLLNSDGANGGGRIYRKVSGYDVPWLFIAEGGTESVRANLTLTKSGKSEIRHPENITFIINDEGGVITLPSEYDAADNTYSVRVSASQADSRQTVYALYQSGDQSHTLGQLDVDTRAPLTAKVCLVNLGGKYDKSRIETNINAIYQRVGVTWSVEEENGFMYPKEKLERLFDKKSGALELYNENQKSLNKAFEAYMGERYDGSTCYVFMMPANGSGSKRDLAGFMPRGEQYGYINTDVILQEQMPAVIAHELGHGKFRLRHTFDSEYGKGAESKKGKTDNLMDYAPTPSSATHIAKWQWNQIHNPALLTELWEKDEDSEWVVQDYIQKLQRIIDGGLKDVLKENISNGTVETGHIMLEVIMNSLLYYHSTIGFENIKLSELKQLYDYITSNNSQWNKFFVSIGAYVESDNPSIDRLCELSEFFTSTMLPDNVIKECETLTQQLIDTNKSEYEVILGLLFEFKYGIGPMERTFDENSVLTKEMKESELINDMRTQYNRNEPYILKKGNVFTGDFGLLEFIGAGMNLTQQYVGGFYAEMYPDNTDSNNNIIKIYNDVNLKSLVLHYLGFNDISDTTKPFPEKYYRLQTNTPLGETRQIFIWKE